MPAVSSEGELVSAVENASPGDEIIAEPGVYSLGQSLRCTTPDVTIRARNDAVLSSRTGPVSTIEEGGGGDLVMLRADGITFRGFEVRNSSAKGVEIDGGPDDVEVAHVDSHNNHTWGVMTNSGSGHTIRDSHSHDNRGSGGNSDGFNGTGAEGCEFLRCYAWNNSDDGFDMWNGTNHTLRECWSWNNGPYGNAEFKLGQDNGGGGHLVENCVAHSSDFIGFSWNQSPNPITVRNCTAFNCAPDFRFEDAEHVLENNISAGNSTRLRGPSVESNNTWNLGIDDPGFVSTDPSSTDFLRLEAGSPCLGAGTDGADLGAFQGGSQPGKIAVEGTTTLAAGAGERTTSPLQTEHTGFNGEGYVNFEADSGASVRWPLDVATGGQYNYEIRYANGGSIDRVATLHAGNAESDITFPQTGGWVNWSTITGTLELPEGTTDLAIETTGDDAGNIDQITLQPIEEESGSSGDEEEQSDGDTPYHGYNIPSAGEANWHEPLNENFEAIDRDVPVVDTEAALEKYDAADGALFVALDTGSVYVGDGAEWSHIGALN